jgi:hypothetical protein
MVALGLLLLVASGLLTAGIVLASTDVASVSAFGQVVSGVTIGGLFAAGVATGVLGLLGVLMMLAGLRRRRARRAGLKREIRDARVEKESLAEENARLQRELAATRSDSTVYPADDPVGRHADDPATHEGGLFHR